MLGSSFGRKILELSAALQGPERHMPAAFRGNAFYLAIQQDHGFLDFDVMKGPLTEVSERIHQAFHELTIPRRVIDRLLERDETS